MSRSVVRNYNVPPEEVFVACVQAIQKLGYKAGQSDRTNGLVTFKTGTSLWSFQGQDMSIVILDSGNGTTNVSIAWKIHKSGMNPQRFDWGEGVRIGNRIARELDVTLKQL